MYHCDAISQSATYDMGRYLGTSQAWRGSTTACSEVNVAEKQFSTIGWLMSTYRKMYSGVLLATQPWQNILNIRVVG